MVNHVVPAVNISWGAEHCRDGGILISRQASISPPIWPACNCLFLYLWATLKYILLLIYHQERIKYAEANRTAQIDSHYRTGNPSPEKMREIIIELWKVKIRRMRDGTDPGTD